MIRELRAGDGGRAFRGAVGARDALLCAGGSRVPSDEGDGCCGISATSTDVGVGEVEAALVSSVAGARAPCSG